MSSSAPADYLSTDQFHDVLSRAHYIQPQAWLLGLSDPVDNKLLKIFGIHKPVSLGGSFYHLLHAVLDENGQPLAYIHAMGEDPNNPGKPVEVAKKGAQLKIFVVSPTANEKRIRNEGHKVVYGEPVAVHANDDWHIRAAGMIHYTETVNGQNLPYTVAENTVRECLKERLDARHDLPHRTSRPQKCTIAQYWHHVALDTLQVAHRSSLVLRRKYIGGIVDLIPPKFFAQIAAITNFPISVSGYNSNSIAADIGGIYGADLRSVVTAKDAPLIGSSPMHDMPELRNIVHGVALLNNRRLDDVADLAGFGTAAPDMTDPTSVILRRPAIVLPAPSAPLPLAA